MRNFFQIFFILGLSVSLTACGGGGGSSSKSGKIDQVIYASSGDCSDAAVLTIEQCEKLIDQAIAKHNKSTKSYSSLRKCEKAEGKDRCERSFADGYRLRLAAYLVNIDKKTKKSSVDPLYPKKSGGKKKDQKPGFLTAKGKEILEEQLEVAFSDRALAAASLY